MQDLFDEYADSLEKYKRSYSICSKIKAFSECKSCEKKVKDKIFENGRTVLKKAYNHIPSKLCMQIQKS
jgi:hypothetical protein